MEVQSNKKLRNLVMVCRGDEILLGLKKRGFGSGHWNGFGGKLELGESMMEAAQREVKEEVGLTIIDPELVGILHFDFKKDFRPLEVHVFRCTDFTGQPTESEEMRPQWFKITALPLDQMWAADRYWLPLFLEGKKFRGRFSYDQPAAPDQEGKILAHTLEQVTTL